MSFTNYCDDGFVIDDLKNQVRKTDGERLMIIWIPDQAPPAGLSSRVLKSIEYYKADFPKLVQACGAEISMIQDFSTQIYLKPNKQIAVEAHIVDDRGRAYICSVYDF